MSKPASSSSSVALFSTVIRDTVGLKRFDDGAQAVLLEQSSHFFGVVAVAKHARLHDGASVDSGAEGAGDERSHLVFLVKAAGFHENAIVAQSASAERRLGRTAIQRVAHQGLADGAAIANGDVGTGDREQGWVAIDGGAPTG